MKSKIVVASVLAISMIAGGVLAIYVSPGQTLIQVAQRVVSRRDEALRTRDVDALFALSVPRSPARAADERLVQVIDERGIDPSHVATVVTSVEKVQRHGQTYWKVNSVQTGVGDSEADGDSAVRTCALWQFDEGSERMFRTVTCHMDEPDEFVDGGS
ncbi:hypothetical protein ACFPGO_01140 [Arcanobacterium canis]|uniref:Uncharacterized protein n=1 Tax=Arcanobacterium canis TaxID=999183 RepID=A0ABY8FW38_9ACTO|nr:hypothetical protein [Arcanobacterium canis]WFM82735.1 hypothetical protein P7079_04825 [Arcanobacterium canis]